jgi:hypothetical protein
MTDTSKAASAAPHQPHPVLDSVVSSTRNWWLLLIAALFGVFEAQEFELKTNTDLTRQIHLMMTELHRRLIDGSDSGASPAPT